MLKNGLFNKLIKLFSNVKQLDQKIEANYQNNLFATKKLKLKVTLSVVSGINFCFDLVKEKNNLSDMVHISKDEFDSLTHIL